MISLRPFVDGESQISDSLLGAESSEEHGGRKSPHGVLMQARQ